MPKTDSRKKKAAPARPPSEEEEEPGARGAELWEFGLGLWFRFCVKWAQNFKHLCFSGLAELSGSEALKR